MRARYSAISIANENSLPGYCADRNSRSCRIREAADYYAAISPDLGKAFRLELRQLMRLVTTMPHAWPVSGEGTRKCLLTGFSYMVIYAPLPGELLVLAVGHQHRQPDYWRERLVDLK